MNTGNVANVAQTVIELQDLVNNLLILLSDKEKTVIKKRFSLNGSNKHTLEDIGKEFSVTRERVRQIEKSALSKMRRNVFNTSLRHIHEFAASRVKDLGGLAKEEDLVNDMIDVLPKGTKFDSSGVHLSLVLHDDLECIGNTINFYPYIREKGLPDYNLKHAANQLINQMHKYGNVKNIEKVHEDLKDIFSEVDFDLTRIRSLIEIDKRLTLIEDDLVGLLEWRHVNPRTLRDKILYTLRKDKNPLHFNHIAEQISQARFDSRPVNVQAVHNELIRHPQFVLIGRGIYALQEWGYESGTVSAVIEKILANEGELSQDEILEMVLDKRQVKKITIVLALKNGEKFERVGRKRYKLKA